MIGIALGFGSSERNERAGELTDLAFIDAVGRDVPAEVAAKRYLVED